MKLLLFAFGAAISAASLAEQVLKVGVNSTGGVLSSYDEKTATYRGLAVDLIAEIAKDAGFQLTYVPMGLVDLIPALQSKAIDIIAGNLTVTPERKLSTDFSEPFHVTREALVVRKTDSTLYKTLADLTGGSLGVQRGSVQHAAAQKTGYFPQLHLYDSMPAVLRDIEAGVISSGLIGYTVATSELAKADLRNVRIVDSYQPVILSSIGFGVRKSDGELLSKLNVSLSRLIAQGVLAQLKLKYGL